MSNVFSTLARPEPVEGRAVLLTVRPFGKLMAHRERDVPMLHYALDDPDDELDEDEDEDDLDEDGAVEDDEDDEDDDEEEEETWQVWVPLKGPAGVFALCS